MQRDNSSVQKEKSFLQRDKSSVQREKSFVQRSKSSVQKTSFCLTSSRVDMRQRHVPTLFVALVLQKHISDIWLIQKLYPAICIFQSFNSQLLYGRNGKCVWLLLFFEKGVDRTWKDHKASTEEKYAARTGQVGAKYVQNSIFPIFLILHKYSSLQNGKYPRVSGEIYQKYILCDVT